MQTSRRDNRPCMSSHNTDLRTTSEFVEGSLESALSRNSSSLLDSPGLYWQHQFVDTCSMWTLGCCTEHANLDQPNGVIEKRGQLAKGEEELLPARMELNHAGVGTTAYTCGPSKKSSHGNTSYRTEISSYTGSQIPQCQAEGCKANLSSAKHYHRRHKVCDLHSKAPTVVVCRLIQRFCQQCSRFHPTSEFDEGKRSCRKRLADHNRRRRKPKRSQRTASQCKSGARDLEDDNNKTKRLSGHDATGIQMIPNMVQITRMPPRFTSVTFLSSGTMMTFPNTLSSSGTMMTYSCATRNI